jgi:hypothetical protein
MSTADSATVGKAASFTSTSGLNPKWMVWTGWVISILPVLGLAMSAAMKFLKPPEVVQGFTKLGWAENSALGLGILEIACTIVYLIPQTSVLGAILLTGYLGGATATHVRISDNFLAPVVMGVMVWLGLYLRDYRLRLLLPFRR